MSLQVGELVAIVGLDDKPLRQGTDTAMTRLARDTEAAAKAAGDRAGDKLGQGIKDGVEGTPPPDIDEMMPSPDGLNVAGLAMGAAVGAALVAGIGEALDVGAGTDKLAAGLGLSPAESEEAGRVAGSLFAGAYGSSMEEVNTAVGSVISTLSDLGVTGEENVERVTAKALDFATAFDQDVSEAVMQAGVLVRTGLATDVDHAMDLMVRGMQEVPMAMRGEVFPILDEYSVHLAALGFTGEEAFGLIAEAAQGGTYEIDKVPDALKELAIRATDGSTTTADAFDLIGLNAESMASRFVAGGEDARGALDTTIGALLAVKDPAEQARAAVALFGTPVEDLAVSQIPEFLTRLDEMGVGLEGVEGAAAAMGDTLNDNAKTRIEAFKRGALMELTNFLGGSVIPAIEKVVDLVRPLVQAFSELPGPVQMAVVAGAGLKMAWDPVSNMMGTMRGRMDGVNSSTVKGATAVTALAGAWVSYTAMVQEAEERARAFTDTNRELIFGQEEGAITSERLRNQYTALVDGINSVIGDFNGSQAPWDADKRAEMREYIELNTEVAGVLERVVNQGTILADEYGVSEDAALQWLSAQAELGNEFLTGQEAIDAYGAVVEENNGLTHEAVEATQDATQALEDHQNMLRAMVDPLFAMMDAVRDNADAQQELIDLELSGVATEDELTDARRRAAGTALDAELATGDLALAVENGTTSYRTGKESLDRWVESGLLTASAAAEMERQFKIAMRAHDELSARGDIRIGVIADTSSFWGNLAGFGGGPVKEKSRSVGVGDEVDIKRVAAATDDLGESTFVAGKAAAVADKATRSAAEGNERWAKTSRELSGEIVSVRSHVQRLIRDVMALDRLSPTVTIDLDASAFWSEWRQVSSAMQVPRAWQGVPPGTPGTYAEDGSWVPVTYWDRSAEKIENHLYIDGAELTVRTAPHIRKHAQERY